MKIAIYTAIIGKRHKLYAPAPYFDNADYIAFMDDYSINRHKKSTKIVYVEAIKRWNIRRIELCDEISKNYRGNRERRLQYKKIKMLSHLFLEGYDYCIWVDSGFIPIIDPIKIIRENLTSNDIAMFKHPDRNCIYEEGRVCIEAKRDNGEIISKQMDLYRSEGYPENNGLVASGIIVKKNTDEIVELNKLWFDQVCKHSVRDQLSFDYAAYKLGISYDSIPGWYWDGGTKEKQYFQHWPGKKFYKMHGIL